MQLRIEDPHKFPKSTVPFAFLIALAQEFFHRIEEEGVSNPKANTNLIFIEARFVGSTTEVTFRFEESVLRTSEIWKKSFFFAPWNPDAVLVALYEGDPLKATIKEAAEQVSSTLFEEMNEKICDAMIGFPE
jgi:hypothetical protein